MSKHPEPGVSSRVEYDSPLDLLVHGITGGLLRVQTIITENNQVDSDGVPLIFKGSIRLKLIWGSEVQNAQNNSRPPIELKKS